MSTVSFFLFLYSGDLNTGGRLSGSMVVRYVPVNSWYSWNVLRLGLFMEKEREKEERFTVGIWIVDWKHLNSELLLVWYKTVNWSVTWMPFDNWTKFSAVFRPPLEYHTDIQMLVWITNYPFYIVHLSTWQVKDCFSDFSVIQIFIAIISCNFAFLLCQSSLK